MKKTVAQALEQYTNQYRSLHMPGHKGGKVNPLSEMDLYQLDITETVYSDDLYHPESFLKKSLDQAKALYGTKKTYYLVNGSTGGILTAISACTKRDDTLILQRNAHHSVYNAMVLNALNPVYLYPELNTTYQLYGGIDLDHLQSTLSEHEEAKAVVITSPNYEGYVMDVQSIAEIVHDHNKILIVDEAHGAHFPFYDFVPKSAIHCGADIVIQSLHKTTPCLTQTGLLHVCSDRVDLEAMDYYYQAYQTSSPSFMLVASIDGAIAWMSQLSKEALVAYEEDLKTFYTKCNTLTHLRALLYHDIYKAQVGFKDMSRLVIGGKEGLVSGNLIAEALLEANIVPELVADAYVVGISTICDSGDLLEDLFLVLEALDQSLVYEDRQKFAIIKTEEKVFKPSTAIGHSKTRISLAESPGYIAGDYVKLYPPSVPLLVPGERISLQAVHLIEYYLDRGLTVHGIENGYITVLGEGRK